MSESIFQYRGATCDLDVPLLNGLFEVQESGPHTRFVLRTHENTPFALTEADGLSLDQPLNRAVVAAEYTSLRLGPGEWLLLAETDAADRLSQALIDAAEGAPYSLVNVSDRTVGLEMTGARVSDALAGGCALPLGTDSFPVNKCTRTIFAKAEVMLWRRAAHQFYVEVARSFLPYLLGLLNVEAKALTAGSASPREVLRPL